MSWWRRLRGTAESSGPAVGLGMLVAVMSRPGDEDAWEGEPIGAVVEGGVNEVYGYPGLASGARFWTVAFDTFAYMADGRGPFERANVPEWRLRAVDPPAG